MQVNSKCQMTAHSHEHECEAALALRLLRQQAWPHRAPLLRRSLGCDLGLEVQRKVRARRHAVRGDGLLLLVPRVGEIVEQLEPRDARMLVLNIVTWRSKILVTHGGGAELLVRVLHQVAACLHQIDTVLRFVRMNERQRDRRAS